MQPTLDYVWWLGEGHYGWLKFIVYNVWTLISSIIKTSLINQYLGSNRDWNEPLFSVVSPVHPWGEMLRLRGPAIKKKGQHTLRLVRQLFEYWQWWFVSLNLRKCNSIEKISQVTLASRFSPNPQVPACPGSAQRLHQWNGSLSTLCSCPE